MTLGQTISWNKLQSIQTINGFPLSDTATASNRVSYRNAFQNIRSQRHILHDIATDHKHFFQLTSRFINRNHYTASICTIPQNNGGEKKHRRKYMRSTCNPWTFLQRGKKWVVSRYGRLVIRLGFSACLSANPPWSPGSVQPNTHTHTHTAQTTALTTKHWWIR